MNRKTDLMRTIQDAREELSQIEAQEREQSNSGQIGRCYKYHNSGGGAKERWWLYMKILRTDESGNLIAHEFRG